MIKQQTHIHDHLAKNAADFSDKPAFICNDRTTNWRELYNEVETAAAYIANLVPNDEQQVIGLLLPNSWQFVVAYLAIVRAGHIALPLDPNYKKLEIASITDQVQPALTITNATFVAEIPTHFATLLFENIPQNNLPAPTLRLPAEEQIASLLFTSGTTGKPKVTAYTHANHLWNIDAVSNLWKWNHKDSLLLSLPLSHWHGLVMGIAGALKHGNTVHLHERFNAEATLKALQSGTVSLFMHVPIAYFKLVEFAGDQQFDISGVRLCISGSSYLPPAIWRGFKKAFGHEILERYGSSETGLIASNTLERRKPGVVGKLLPGVQMRAELNGELAMRSAGRFLGYFKNHEATHKNTTPDGWWLTGDLGEFDEDGNLILKGRIQEKIKKLGYTVYPRDVEWALLQHDGIHDVVVVGLQDKNSLSDRIAYFTISDIAEADIEAFCKANLPAAWRPDIIMCLPEIPKTRSGKPQLATLKAMVSV